MLAVMLGVYNAVEFLLGTPQNQYRGSLIIIIVHRSPRFPISPISLYHPLNIR